MTDSLLRGLDDIPWQSLRSGGGVSGKPVPGLLRKLAAATSEERANRYADQLEPYLTQSGLLYELSAYAVPFVVALAGGAENEDVQLSAMALLERIAYAEPERTGDPAADGQLAARVRGDLLAARELCYARLAHREPAMRALALGVLAPLERQSERFVGVLRRFETGAEDPLVTAAVKDAWDYLHDR